MQILAFGDSITYGCWDEEGGWVERIKKELNKKAINEKDFWGVIYNLGITGGTTDHLIERFKTETEQRIEADEECYFIFAFGANDAAYDQSERRFQVSVKDFRNNLSKVIQSAKVFSSDIILLTITPVNQDVVEGIEGDKIRKNEFVEQYNAALHELAKAEQLSIIDLYQTFIHQTYKTLLCSDGLHPNTKGHELIFEQVWEHFKDKF